MSDKQLISVRIDRELWKRVRAVAVEMETTAQEIVETAVTAILDELKKHPIAPFGTPGYAMRDEVLQTWAEQMLAGDTQTGRPPTKTAQVYPRVIGSVQVAQPKVQDDEPAEPRYEKDEYSQ